MIRRILLTLDGSVFAEAAIPAALGLATRTGAELRLLSVHDSGWARAHGAWGDGARTQAQRYLERVREQIRPIWSEVSVTATDGFVVDEILREARTSRADVIVMATHGRGPISRFWLGSMATQCLRRTKVPMLLIRPEEGVAPAPSSAFVFGRVVVPLDGSPFAETALGPALEVADRFGRPLTLVRVVQNVVAAPVEGFPEHQGVSRRMLTDARADARSYLDEAAAQLRAQGIAPRTRVLTADAIAPALLEEARGDLLVLATHARRGLSRAFLGSVTDGVVRSATGPVLAVPPDATRSDGVRTRPSLAPAAVPLGL